MKGFMNRNSNREGEYTDKVVKFCISCKCCFEKINFMRTRDGINKRVYGYFFYDNFPSYGKEKTTCVKCSGKEKLLLQKLDENMPYYEILKS